MTGCEFHPEARFDLDEIWEFIRADSVDAADRMIAEVLAAVGGLVPFSQSRPQAPRPHITPVAVHSGARLSCSLCTRREATVGRRGFARQAKPSRDGCDTEGQRVVYASKDM